MARIGPKKSLAHTIDSLGWAVFFIWIGIALLAGIDFTWSLIGTALIILGVQAALRFKGESIDVFVLAVGIVLLVGTIADAYGSPWFLIPAFLVLIGLAMLANTLLKEAGTNA